MPARSARHVSSNYIPSSKSKDCMKTESFIHVPSMDLAFLQANIKVYLVIILFLSSITVLIAIILFICSHWLEIVLWSIFTPVSSIKLTLAPLGISAWWLFVFSVQEMMAVGYNVDGTQAIPADCGWVSPPAQMYSSTQDLDTVSQ